MTLAWKVVAVLLSAIVSFGVGAFIGMRMGQAELQAELLESQEIAQRAYEQKVRELNAVSTELEKRRMKREVVYETITRDVEKIVERPTYRNVCLDESGVQLINAALAGAYAASESDAALPATFAP